MTDGYYSINKRNELIKNITKDIDDIKYMLKNTNIEELSDVDLQEFYSLTGKIWLLLSSIYK